MSILHDSNTTIKRTKQSKERGCMKTINTVTFDNERWVKLSDVEHLIKINYIMSEALVWCDEFFTSRDKMNAQVHCAPIRLSPITERVRNALEENK